MDFTNDNRINERILMGNFPDCQIKKDSKRDILINDISNKEQMGHSLIKHFQTPLHLVLHSYLDQVNTCQNEYGADVLYQDFNFLINTLINPDTVNVDNKIIQQTIHLFPAITVFDKALWGAVFDTYALSLVENKEWINVSYAWIRLLRIVELKELKYKRTVDLSKINETTPILDILYKAWDDISNPCLIEITSQEASSLEKLASKQERLREECLALIEKGSHIAEQTESKWEQFLAILNDIQMKESEVAAQICAPISTTEKINAITEYNCTINKIKEGFYTFQNEVIALEPIFAAMEERFKNAPAHCFVSDCDGNSFRLCYEAIQLIRNPTTFNYLFIAYHHFRMDPTQNNALSFLKLALISLKNNLLEDNIVKEDSIDVIVQSFYNTVKRFWQENHTAISKLSFDKVQQDAIINGESSGEALLINRMRSRMYIAAKETLLELDTSLSATESFNDTQALVSQFNTNYYKKLGVEGNNLEQYFENQFAQEFARLLVISLNIIYLFCDALKIISDESNCHTYVENLDAIDEHRDELQHIHTDVARKVYSKEVNLRKYRKEAGIYADVLSKQEANVELLRSNTFISICINYLSKLDKSIRGNSIEGLLDLNRRFRTEILRCPAFIRKDEHTKKLEEISNDICNSLIEIFEEESPEMLEKEKQAILSELGIGEQVLPVATANALATAELLFHKYASVQYQMEGFDYSSISALYYQAFEAAYNSLIWQKYVAYLDSVQIDNQNLAEYFYECKTENGGKIEDSSAFGYLPERELGKYLKKTKKNHSTCFNSSISYELFCKLMSDISGKKTLDKLCDFFAENTGFSDRHSMFEDKIFMKYITRFANKINRKTDNRNMASHGGNVINFHMCSDDKKAVLFDLEKVREDSISLIQLLLYLVSYNKTTE